jgi:hypothetical protein
MEDIIEQNYNYNIKYMSLYEYFNLFYHKVFQLYLYTGDPKLIYQLIYKLPLFYDNIIDNNYNFLIGDVEVMRMELIKKTKIKITVKVPTELHTYINEEIKILCDNHPLEQLVNCIKSQSIDIYQKRFLLLLDNDEIYYWSEQTKNNYFNDIKISKNLIENYLTFSSYVPCSSFYINYYLTE